jgi:DNA-binding MarR family transcriptional regulator
MAPLIAALIKRGLVERIRLDGRSQALRLSTRGAELSRQVGKVIECHEKRLFGSLRPAVRRLLLEQLRTLWQRER